MLHMSNCGMTFGVILLQLKVLVELISSYKFSFSFRFYFLQPCSFNCRKWFNIENVLKRPETANQLDNKFYKIIKIETIK